MTASQKASQKLADFLSNNTAKISVRTITTHEAYIVVATGDAPVHLLQFVSPSVQAELYAQYKWTGYKANKLEIEAVQTDNQGQLTFAS